jgi:hypothetical protein
MTAVPWEHRQALLVARRCGWCAETVPPALVLRGGSCPSCERAIYSGHELGAEAVLRRVHARWSRWRLPVYGGVLLSTGLASLIPLGGPLAYAVAMVTAHLFIVRRPMLWLGLGRRLAARFTLKLFLATLTLLNLIASAVVFPLVGVGNAVVAVTSCALAVIYVEVALWLVGNRLRREARGDRLSWGEWGVPALLIGALFGTTGLMVGAATLAVHTMLWADIPGVSDIAAFLLSTGGS